jgi:hypothetical protein
MKKLTLNSDYASLDNYRNLISDFTDKFQIDSYKDQKKNIEVCQVGKFLMFFDNQFKIDKVREEPDFIIASDKNKIGLELQTLIDSNSKEKEGFFTNLVKHAEKELRRDKNIPNFLANVYVHPSFHGKINEKERLVNQILQIIKIYINTGELVENDIIYRISTMKHSQISLCPNMGAWWQKDVTGGLIISTISKKEKKIDNYLKNTNLPQWLLIIIGGVGKSSYIIEREFELSIETRFEKVYVLEDFYTNLFEIK